MLESAVVVDNVGQVILEKLSNEYENIKVANWKECKDLFDNIRTELKDLELIELSQKEQELNDQSQKVISTLNFVQSISICNLILNAALFIITVF